VSHCASPVAIWRRRRFRAGRQGSLAGGSSWRGGCGRMSTEGSGGAVKDMGRVLLVRGEVVVTRGGGTAPTDIWGQIKLGRQ
jgi:hypothetical protein